MNFPFYIAKRYLFSKKSHNAINVISAISVCGVALATLAMVCTLSVFNGFQDVVATFFTAFDPELKITATAGKVFDGQDERILELKKLPEVAVFSESLEENAMVQLIVGEKGKGKTKVLLDKANNGVKEAKGSVVYLDKSTKHMYELNNKVRLINVTEYEVENASEFVGFIRGILSQDNDLEQVYLDSFLKIAKLEAEDAPLTEVLQELEKLSERFGLSFIISVSRNEEDLPEAVKGMIETSL